MFHGACIGSIVYLMVTFGSFMIGVRCMSQRRNLVVQTLSNFHLVSIIEDMFQSLNNHFTQSN